MEVPAPGIKSELQLQPVPQPQQHRTQAASATYAPACAKARPLPMAYGGSQARGPIGAVATSLHQSHSNSGSEPRLQPTPQLTATPDP
eukprot:TsM_001148800 transcript=TsM_001148800 gene=TsM_001148800